MGMVLNTNMGSIQAQRALSESRKDMELAMERLSTGSRINSAADDAAGLGMIERMSTQVRGLQMATRNANDGIALIKTVENALVEVSGMLQRMRELGVQSANDTNTTSERNFANNEFNQLQLEISRVSLNTRYNGAQVLNGSFAAKSLQIGTESGETLDFSIENVESSQLGAYVVDGITAQAASFASGATIVNTAAGAEDLVINAGRVTREINVEAGDTAKETAKKINAVAGGTQVTAEGRSFAWLYSSTTSSATVQLAIANNGSTTFTETAAFSLSSADVSDAVQKINAISSSTGVQASATDDYKVLLTDKDGDDIIIKNLGASARTDLYVQTVGIGGAQPYGYSENQIETVTVGTLANYNGNTVIGDGSTNVTISHSGGAPANIDTLLTQIQAGSGYGNLLFDVTKASATTLAFTWKAAGDISATAAYTVAGASDEAIATSSKPSGTNAINMTVQGGAREAVLVRGNLRLSSTRDFSVTQESATEYFTLSKTAAPYMDISSLDITTRIGSTDSLAIIDGAIAKVSAIRGSLGTLQNRLDYCVSNLLKVTEFTISARSRIQDADFAAETSRLAKAQVLQQAGAAMLSQANASTDTVLQLLRA
jgi:flagellin